MSTRMPFPTARSAVPIAAVVFPLPGPVLTMIRPRRMSSIGESLIVSGLHPLRRQGSPPAPSRQIRIVSGGPWRTQSRVCLGHFYDAAGIAFIIIFVALRIGVAEQAGG